MPQPSFKNAHIINVPSEEHFINEYLSNGYIGVGLVLRRISPQSLSRACRTSYSMFADMKTIRQGDIIFVHAGQNIYGAFRAESEFKESPVIPAPYQSTNIHYYPKPDDPNTGWQNQINELPDLGDFRQISISHYVDEDHNNLCFQEGISSTEIFDLRSKKKIFSVPERWLYTDSSRTIRPLLFNEAVEILKLIESKNSDINGRHEVTPKNLNNFNNISFVLNPNIVQDEKIIEGYILSQLGQNPEVDNHFGKFHSFGNNIPGGYLKFMDIFGYQSFVTDTKKYKVVEIKKNHASFPNDINQVIGYTDWVIENLASGIVKNVEGILVAKGFTDETVQLVSNLQGFGRNIKLISFNYSENNFDQLDFTRIA
ncbi:MAG: hypothetical protein WDZ38_00610 [Balneolaceae bacterium]